MRILITNDDGIRAEGLLILTAWAQTMGAVTVVAPLGEQSGKSHSINFQEPLRAEETTVPKAARAYAVSSTPADCVRFAVRGLHGTYDLALAGINAGLNIGHDIVYSGTVGAISEAAHLGIPSVALSAEPEALREAGAQLDVIRDFFLRHDLLGLHPLYNVNIPPVVRGIRTTTQGGGHYADRLIPAGGGLYRQTAVYVPDEPPRRGCLDTVAVGEGFVSVTPLSLNAADRTVYRRIRSLR